mgnify:CR=1 FL=1
MSENPKSTQALVEPAALGKIIQGRLDQRRQTAPYLQLTLTVEPWFEDGSWRAVVQPTRKSATAADYADVLAGVEEEVLDACGVNILLIPAKD